MRSELNVSLETSKEFDATKLSALSLLPQHCEHAQPHPASFDQHSANNMLAQDLEA